MTAPKLPARPGRVGSLVYDEPVGLADGVTMIPVSRIRRGSATAVGVFVLKDGKVSWHPAIDVNRIVLGGQLVAVVALLVARSVLRGTLPAFLPAFPPGRWPALGKARRKAIRSAAKTLKGRAARLPSVPGSHR